MSHNRHALNTVIAAGDTSYLDVCRERSETTASRR